MNVICKLFDIKYPIIQGGMIWCSGWELASAVSNAGGLGLIGAGSMYPEILEENIIKCKQATNKPFGVNLPMLYPDLDKHIELIIKHNIKIVFTSAGNPAKYTPFFKQHGVKVVHVVSNVKFALKAQDAGVDAIVCEGFEAGGHNGREETTTLCLVPLIKQHISIPLIAAGGIGSGASMLAVMALGAQGVQVGSRFVVCKESSAHENFKKAILNSKEGDTFLALKQLTPVRLLKNKFAESVALAELNGATKEQLTELLGRARAKKGMFEGNLDEGELEIGQVAYQFDEISSAQTIIDNMIQEYAKAKQHLNDQAF